MKTYVLLHFEHKNDVRIIVKLLYGARVIVVQALNECIMFVSCLYRMHQKCIIHLTYCKRDHEQYSLKVKRPVVKDKRRYVALSQLVSKLHYESIMDVS